MWSARVILCALVIFPFIDDSDVLPFSAIDKKNRCFTWSWVKDPWPWNYQEGGKA